MKKWQFEKHFSISIIALTMNGICFAQTSEFDPKASPTPSSSILQLTERAVEITKKSMRVLSEEEGVVTTTLYGTHSLVNKAQVVFFRRRGARMEVIAQGEVSGEKKDPAGKAPFLLVELNRESILKYPQSGDYAVPMADPNAIGNGDKKDQYDYLVPDEKIAHEENDRPGYLEGALGIMQGTLTTQASVTSLGDTQVNGAKKTSDYRFKQTHLAYFSEYLPVGIEYDSHRGNFPTQTYYRKVVSSSESVSNLSFSYRLKTLFHRHLAPVLKVSMLSDEFKTDNTDENLLSTKISGLGFGTRINYDLVAPNWKAERGEFFLRLQNLYAEFLYYPGLTAQDTGVSRGTSSPGSSGMQYRLGFNTLLYVPFIPFFKRFVLQGSYGVRDYQLKFSGPTVSEAGNANKINENGHSHEREQDYRFFFGLRFDDPVKLLFGNAEGKKR